MRTLIRRISVRENIGYVLNAKLLLPTCVNVGNAIAGNVENVHFGAPSALAIGRESILFVLIVMKKGHCWFVMRTSGVALGAVRHDIMSGANIGEVIRTSVPRLCYFAFVPRNIYCSVSLKHESIK